MLKDDAEIKKLTPPPPPLKSHVYLSRRRVCSIFYHKRLHEPSVDAAHTSHLPPLVSDGRLLLLLLLPLQHRPRLFLLSLFLFHAFQLAQKTQTGSSKKSSATQRERITRCQNPSAEALLCVCESAAIGLWLKNAANFAQSCPPTPQPTDFYIEMRALTDRHKMCKRNSVHHCTRDASWPAVRD